MARRSTKKRSATAPAAPASNTPKPDKAKRKRGRPSKYDPAFCDLVLELGEQGKSRMQMAARLGVTYDTFLEWQKRHPDFLEAVKFSQVLAQEWWEDAGQRGLTMGKAFNGVAFVFQMKNRFRTDYSDKIEVKHDATAAFAQCWQAIGSGNMGHPQ